MLALNQGIWNGVGSSEQAAEITIEPLCNLNDRMNIVAGRPRDQLPTCAGGTIRRLPRFLRAAAHAVARVAGQNGKRGFWNE
jgi:hypothetical protein